MFLRNRKFIASYIACVVLPLFVLGAVLKWGGALVARPVLSGIWHIKIDSSQVAGLPCPDALLRLQKGLIGFSQLGKTFSLILSGAQLPSRGVIEGYSLKASFVLLETDDPSVCGGFQQLGFEAVIDPKSDPRSMNGVLFFTSCGSCRPVRFQAVRESVGRIKD